MESMTCMQQLIVNILFIVIYVYMIEHEYFNNRGYVKMNNIANT